MNIIDLFRHWDDVEEYAPQGVIFSAGAPADLVYVILSGEVQLALNGEPVGNETAGSIIGVMAIKQAATRSATATALTDVKVARLDRDQLNDLMIKMPEFSLQVMSVLANRLRAADQYIITKLDQSND
jgi:CRP-like cAMP-binding protein